MTLEFPDDPLLREYWEGCVAAQLRIHRSDRWGMRSFIRGRAALRVAVPR